jgi:hypothetical protein
VIYKAPESWKLMYKKGNRWEEVHNLSPYGTEENRYNRVEFEPVTTTELKMVVRLRRPEAGDGSSGQKSRQAPEAAQRGYSGGVIEWKVF